MKQIDSRFCDLIVQFSKEIGTDPSSRKSADEEGMSRHKVSNHSGYSPIAGYGVIGDCHTVALIAREGSIDWYCPGRFDNPAVFCRLLDIHKGGYLKIAPSGPFTTERSYEDASNILLQTFSDGKGKVRITYLMPVFPKNAEHRGYDVGTSRRIIQHIQGLDGETDMSVEFFPTFNYARGRTEFDEVPDLGTIAHSRVDGKDRFIALHCYLKIPEFSRGNGRGLSGRFRLRAGEECWIGLNDADTREQALSGLDPDAFRRQLDETRAYWHTWALRCTYNGQYRKEVLRSALVLKLLTYEPTGAIVAATTTSLPEKLGGVRNWDYRFTWLRDSALILAALLGVGYEQEAADFFEWLQETNEKSPRRDLQVLYAVDGRHETPETLLDHLEGYRKSRPVRIGNAASEQLQLDIYGEIMTSANLYFRSGMSRSKSKSSQDTEAHPERRIHEDWPFFMRLVQKAKDNWQEPDNGIWEVRGGLQHFLYSKLMCWAALDRGISLAEEYRMQAPLDAWKKTREEIRKAILEQGYNRDLGSFVQSFGSNRLDASVLILPRLGILPPTDPRIRSTIRKVSRELSSKGFLYRYRTGDSIPGSEATFALCTFWLIDSLALSGNTDQAHRLFEHIVPYANDLGLFSEEIDPDSGELLGNFPQGFTHMAVINSAINLAKISKHGPEQKSETEYERAVRGKKAAEEGHSRHG